MRFSLRPQPDRWLGRIECIVDNYLGDRFVPRLFESHPGIAHALAEIDSDVGLRGDFTLDGTVNADDIDLLYATANLGTYYPLFDLTDDNQISKEDVDELVRNVLRTEYGDANLDGRVSIGDLSLLAQNFGKTSRVGWGQGDFNGDGRVSIGDLSLIAQNFGFDNSEDL